MTSGVRSFEDMPNLNDQLAQISPDLLRACKSREISDAAARILSKCISIARANSTRGVESLRTVHHLSCAGGTMITKCIASMSNVLILNELDFHSSLTSIAQGNPSFAPTDMVSLLRQGDADIDEELLTRLLLENLSTVLVDQSAIGRTVVLREHSHGHFLVGPRPQPEKATRTLLDGAIPTLSLVTVRDPAESYYSMVKSGWHTHFEPSDFDEYANRYHAFLDTHEQVPIVKYECFVDDPHSSMKTICEILNLRFFDGFLKTFSLFRFSGDSGRGGQTIKAFSPREEANPYRQLTSYRDLARRLGYDSDPER